MATMSEEIRNHVSKLKNLCRICGKYMENDSKDRAYDKNLFKMEMKSYFGIFVDTDIPEIHPKYICKTDARMLYRYRDQCQKGETTVGFLPKKVYIFDHHGMDCEVCTPQTLRTRKPAGRKRKRDKLVTPTFNSFSLMTSGSTDTDIDNGYVIPGCSRNKKQKTETVTSSSYDNTEHAEGSELNNPSSISFLLKQTKKLLEEMETEDKRYLLKQFTELLSPADTVLMSYYLGKGISDAVAEDSSTFSLLYKDIESLADIKIFNWLSDRNANVISFMLGIGKLGNDLTEIKENKEKLLALAHALEQLYMIRTPKLISPLSFLLNISCYTLTGSKTMVDMIGKCSPAGHYGTVKQWLQDQGSEQTSLPEGDLINVFDNEQVIGKSHAIKPANKVKVSVITNKGIIALNSEKSLQSDQALKPQINQMNLFQHNLGKDDIIIGADKEEKVTSQSEKLKCQAEKMITQSGECYSELENEHEKQLHYFVEDAIKDVLNDQKKEKNEFVDSIDEKVQKVISEETTVKCSLCGTLNPKRKQICEGCNDREGIRTAKNMKKSSNQSDTKDDHDKSVIRIDFEMEDDHTVMKEACDYRYNHVESNHIGSRQIILTDPVFCNPNSFETIARVLRQIGIENGISKYGGNKRHWTFVCCDGLPFMICKKLKEEAVVCTVSGCSKKCLKKADFVLHAKKCHPELTECSFTFEFDWFYLRIGSGHYEMNLLKSFVELNWIPFFEVLAEKMGFVSDTAKQYAKSCKDNHKSWTLLLIFHMASLRELVTPYVRHCLLTGEQVGSKGFFMYIQDEYKATNRPNLKYLMDQVCRFSQGIINFRMSVRRNNSKLLKSAKYMTKEIFHGRSHPKYQTIELYDKLQDALMPDEVRALNDQYSSVTASGNPSLGEDMDFILEEKNKQLKAWIPKGVPTDSIWQTVCRNNAALEQVKQTTLDVFGIRSDKGSIREIEIGDAVDVFRAVLRRSNYIAKVGGHTGVEGTALDEGLVNFLEDATKRRMHTIRKDILRENEDTFVLRHPIPVTPEERSKIQSVNNMTVEELSKEIRHLLGIIPDAMQKEYHTQMFLTEVKDQKKSKYISFLTELKEAMSQPQTKLTNIDN